MNSLVSMSMKKRRNLPSSPLAEEGESKVSKITITITITVTITVTIIITITIIIVLSIINYHIVTIIITIVPTIHNSLFPHIG
jgi:hypothetical protein